MMHVRLPGVHATRTVEFKQVVLADPAYLPGGVVIDAAQSRDVQNSVITELRAGMVLGRLDSSGQYAPSYVGELISVYDKDAVDGSELRLVVSTAVAGELLRRLGGVGVGKEIVVSGPAVSSGEVTSEVVQVNAIDTVTGELTINAVASVDWTIGSLVSVNDGSQTPRVIMSDGYPLRVVDADQSNVDAPLSLPLIGGLLDVNQVNLYPTDNSLSAWFKAQLNNVAAFQFSDDF